MFSWTSWPRSHLRPYPLPRLLKGLSGNEMSSDTRFSFESLKDPKVLLQKAPTGRRCVAPSHVRLQLTSSSPALEAWDARLGAVIDANTLLVTPNASVLFRPPTGNNREMALRENYRYGQDDHLCLATALQSCPPASWVHPAISQQRKVLTSI